MNQECLDKLLGLSVKEVKTKVEQDGYELWSLAAGTITASITRPYNLVEVYFDENNIVIEATNQQIVDEFYQNKENSMQFKQWVESHNPDLVWNWDDPDQIEDQLNSVIKECGNLDIYSVFKAMFNNDSPGLTPDQTDKFLAKTKLKTKTSICIS